MEPQQSDTHTEETPHASAKVGVGADANLGDDQQEQQQQQESADFDADAFAALLQRQLIAYNCSWDPLTKALEALAASMGKQQRQQQHTNETIDAMRGQLQDVTDRLVGAETAKQELADAVSQLQDQVTGLNSELQTAKEEQKAHEAEVTKLKQEQAAMAADLASTSSKSDEESSATPTPTVSPSPPPAAAFATANELQEVKQKLTNQLRKSLSAVFGEEFVVHDGEEEEEEQQAESSAFDTTNSNANTNADTVNANTNRQSQGEPTSSEASVPERPPSRPGTGISGVLRTPLPGVPFASKAMVKAELAKLHDLQSALEAKLSAQKQAIVGVDDRLGAVDAKLDESLALQQQQQRRQSRQIDPAAIAAMGPSNELLQKQISELHDQHAALLKQLQDHATATEKQASGIKELAATLDDLAMQQAMYRSVGATKTDTNSPRDANTNCNTPAPGHLDLSLVFTKIAELRRTTDASIDQIQASVKQAASASASQQNQLDALRNASVFTELQQLRLLEAQLALQKELLDRNQTHQDRTKPQLAEWKKLMEQTEEKLVNKLCDQDTMDELEQLQRNYHRTMLTMSPLINSPLTIAESLQRLTEAIKSLQSGVEAGIIPITAGVGVGVGENANTNHLHRVEEFATKLRYLDEEVAATNQVNVVTEKKNDPLLKTLDTMREKLDRMWSLWHQNHAKKHAKSTADSNPWTVEPQLVSVSTPTPTPTASVDGLKDVELKLMGTVRRINSVEEEVDRLAALVSANAGGHTARSQVDGLQAKADVEDVAKLRTELHEEIQTVAKALARLEASTTAATTASGSGRGGSPAKGDLVGDLHSQMIRRRDVDGRSVLDGPEDDHSGQRTMYDTLLRDLTKKVTQSVLQTVDKGGRVGATHANANAPAGIAANPNVNFRALLENFTQKFDDRLEDTREFTLEELAKLRKELLDLLKNRLENALRELRAEFQLVYYPPASETGDSTAVGTKPVMCVACSRPVPVSGQVRDANAYPSAELIAEQTNALLHAELEYDRGDEDYVFRAGFKMPADRKTMTLPFLATNIRNRIALNKIERKPRRPARHAGTNPVDTVVKEAMDLDRKQRYHHHPPSPPK